MRLLVTAADRIVLGIVCTAAMLGTPRPTAAGDVAHPRAQGEPETVVHPIQSDEGILFPNLPDLIKQSVIVAVARPVRNRAYRSADGASVTTDYTVRVQEVLKGNVKNGDRLIVSIPGGVHRLSDGRFLVAHPTDALPIDSGRSYVLFLRSGEAPRSLEARASTRYSLTGGAQGFFQINGGRVISMSRLGDAPLRFHYSGAPMQPFLHEIRGAIAAESIVGAPPAGAGGVTTFNNCTPGYLSETWHQQVQIRCDQLGFQNNTFMAYVAKLRYRVLDETTSPIEQAGMSVAESNTNGSGSCGTGAPGNSSWTTDSGGEMTQDDYIANCSPTCFNGGQCTASWTQAFRVDGTAVSICDGNCFGVWPVNNWTTSCSGYPTR